MTPRKAILDTGPLYALFDRDDEHHQQSVAFVQQQEFDLLTTWPVITEVTYLLRFDPRAQTDFLHWIRQGGALLVDLVLDDLDIAVAVLTKYADLPADFADASLIAIADRLQIRQIATYDGDFRVYRYRRRYRFVTLLLDAGG